MEDEKRLRTGFDLYFEYQGKRMLDESLFFILQNLKDCTLCWDFLDDSGINIYGKKISILSEFLGQPIDTKQPAFSKELIQLMSVFEREREGISKYLNYGRPPALTVDGVIFKDEKLLLIKRGNEPFKGMYALPGGFVNYGESTEDAVVREVQEETGLKTVVRDLLGVYSDPGRDPRGHTVSTIYLLDIESGEMQHGDDAAAVELIDPDHLPGLAFDHEKVIRDAIRKNDDSR